MECRAALLLIALIAATTREAATAAVKPATARLGVLPTAAACPCAAPSLCRPVQVVHKREVFGFSLNSAAPYERYDWSQLTTVAWNEDPRLMCAAHAAGARVVLNGGPPQAARLLANRTARAAWLAGQVHKAVELHLDGINFDLEDPMQAGDPLAVGYAELVAEAAAAFHAAIPGSQVSVDVPWSPLDIDGRSYRWRELAAAADLLFVMAYDMQSQIWGSCVASSNSPPALVRRGLEQWLQLGVPASKLVLGLPWYGYGYPCQNPAYAEGREELCALQPTPFRGAPCSDAAGWQIAYSDVLAAVRRGATSSSSSSSSSGGGGGSSSSGGAASGRKLHSARPGSAGRLRDAAAPSGTALHAAPAAPVDQLVCEPPQLDVVQQSPRAACRWASDPPGSRRFQLWFDSAPSLELKYGLAAELGLRGVGMWHLDCLDFGCSDQECRAQTEAMWDALRAFPRADSGRQEQQQWQGQATVALTSAAAAEPEAAAAAADERRKGRPAGEAAVA